MKESVEEKANRLAGELLVANHEITILQTSVISNMTKINRAINAILEIDDGDPRLASQINHVMNILEGKA